MDNYSKLEQDIEKIIKSLKGICSQQGLGNASGEEKVITTVFLYKFLNDKFMYNITSFSNEIGMDIKDIFENKKNSLDAFYDAYSDSVAFEYEDTIEYLIQFASHENFYKKFDQALESISINHRNKNFNLISTDGSTRPLFEKISGEVEESSRDNFAKAIFSDITQKKIDFSFAFENGSFDFYSRIFEYLIKDYNIVTGKYGEYFTPQSVSNIIAKILRGISKDILTCEIYDPCAGSGSLALHLTNAFGNDNNVSRALLYTQDISQKSSRFLRLNMILNGITDSLHNAIQGDTLLHPAHYNIEKNSQSGLKKFDFIVSNPPFYLDFSSTRDTISNIWEEYLDADGDKRFFAGIPTIPDKDKDSMPIYLCFIQHIIFSLKKGGRAAIVVPSSFLTKSKGIEKKIREYMVEKKLIKGVITMPAKIFTNTGTSVSVLFIGKYTNESEKVKFIDATGYGYKVVENGKQHILLSKNDQEEIIKMFLTDELVEKKVAIVDYGRIEKNDFRFSPTSYFDYNFKFEQYTEKQLENKVVDLLGKARFFYSDEIKNLLKETFNYWFIQFDFPHNGKPYHSSGGKMVYSEVLDLDIPEGWEVKPILEVCSVVDCLHSKKPDYVFENEECYLLSLENLTPEGKFNLDKKYYISQKDYEIWSKKIEIQEGDFLITNSGRIGCFGVVPSWVKCAIGRNLTAIRANNISYKYFKQYLESPYIDKYLSSNLDEGAFFKSFNVKSIKKINVLVPPKDIIDKYLEICGDIIDVDINGFDDERIKNVLKNSFLKLVTGK